MPISPWYQSSAYSHAGTMTRNAMPIAQSHARSTVGFLNRKAAQCITALAVLLLCAIPAHAQSTGTLMPNVPGAFYDNSGNPCSGCLVYFYVAGTTTLQSTYSDSALSVANTNPIVLNSAGRNPAGGIYFSAASYKVILQTAAAATLFTLDNVAAVPYTTVASTFNSVCDGRLTLTTSTPVTVSDVTAATTVRWTPYKGNRCALYDGAQWNLATFTELSLSLGADAANTNYDVFLYLSSGTATLERVAWTNDTTRAVSITFQDGVYTKSSDTTKRYVGTYRTTAVVGQTEDSAAKRFVWNYYNRVPRSLRVTEAADSWTYTTAVFRQVNANTANQVAVVVGVAEATVSVQAVHIATNSASANVVTGIGEDSTTTAASGLLMQQSQASAVLATPYATLVRFPAIGYHFYAWLEYSGAAGTTTWYGDNAVPTVWQTGMTGTIGGL
jgi:hypothetical protein